MKTNLFNQSVLITLLLGSACACWADPPSLLTPTEPSPSPNHFSLSYRMAFNIRASFNNIGAVGAQSNPNRHDNPAHPGFWLRTYDDGYVGEDITHDMHGVYQGTWFWGYDNSSQVQGDTISMHSSSSLGTSSADRGDDLQNGFELTYNRELQRFEEWRWGLEGAFNFTRVSIRDSRTVTANFSRVTDTYQLNGVLTPAPGYRGTFENVGGGPVIGDTPSRSTSLMSEPIT